MISRTTGRPLNIIEQIKQSIDDILTTPIGSRVFRRDYGSELPNLLSKPLNANTIALMRAATVTAINKFESRVNIKKCIIKPESTGKYSINLFFEYLGNPQEFNTIIGA